MAYSVLIYALCQVFVQLNIISVIPTHIPTQHSLITAKKPLTASLGCEICNAVSCGVVLHIADKETLTVFEKRW